MLSRAWSLRECADATGGAMAATAAAVSFTNVSTDSRTIQVGDLFVALRGPNFDGHAFVGAAHAEGAVAAVVARDAEVPADVPVVRVDDTLHALGAFAAAVLDDRECRVVGITGSCGKTTAKNMTAAVLGTTFAVGATPGNLNNLIGLPQTVFGLPDPCDVAVLELATSAPGEIRRLSEIARPHVGVITNIAAAHLEGLRTLEGVRAAKAELLDGMRDGGTLLLNADDATTSTIRARYAGPVVTFGFAAEADVRAADVRFDAAHHSHFRVNDTWDVEMPVYGRAAVANALIAFAVGQCLEVPADDMLRALSHVAPEPMRMEIQERAGIYLINDAYNANPHSMAAALTAFENGSFPGRKIAVLGDMLELGTAAEGEHEKLGRRLAEYGVDLVYLFGEYAETVRESAVAAGLQAERVYPMTSHAAIVDSLRYVLRAGDVVLVKGSRSTHMERVASGLWEVVA